MSDADLPAEKVMDACDLAISESQKLAADNWETTYVDHPENRPIGLTRETFIENWPSVAIPRVVMLRKLCVAARVGGQPMMRVTLEDFEQISRFYFSN